MNIAAIGTGIWGFLKRIPDWVLWALAAIIFLKFVDMRAEHRGRKEEGAKRDKEAAEVEREVVTNIQENTDAVIAEADAVRSHTAAGVLPDGSSTLEKHHYRD
jgi:type III secretory pathway component EscV